MVVICVECYLDTWQQLVARLSLSWIAWWTEMVGGRGSHDPLCLCVCDVDSFSPEGSSGL